MSPSQGAPHTYWLIQDARGAPAWIYIVPVYKTGRQLEATMNPETALRFTTYQGCLNYINSHVQIQLEWMPVEYVRYSEDRWERVVPNQNT